MRHRRTLSAPFALICAFALAPVACKPPEKEPDLGDKLEKAAGDVGEALNKAADEMEEGAGKIKESMEKAGDELERSADELEDKLDDQN